MTQESMGNANDIELAGLAEQWRTTQSTRQPGRAPRIIAVAAAAGLTLASLEACSTNDQPGQVYEGADGQTYVLPEGAERPVYATREECLADIQERIEKAKQDGAEITETAEQLCEPVDDYRAGGTTFIYPWYLYGRGLYFGPVMSQDTKWSSPRITEGWHTVQNGGFARAGGYVQQGITRAPVGTSVGDKVTIKGGFGGTGKGGFVRGGGS